MADFVPQKEPGWERERLLEALDAYRRGLCEPPLIRKWSAAPGVQEPAGISVETSRDGVKSSSTNLNENPEGNPESPAMAFVNSTDEVDRHGDVIATDGWQLDSYKKNPVFLWAHDYARPVIGKASEIWKEPHLLMARIQFAPTEFAQEVATLYQSGYQRGVSVGFKPLRYEERRHEKTGAFLGLRFLEQELLETSAVPVPANRNALRRAMARATLSKEYLKRMEPSLPESPSLECPDVDVEEATFQLLWPELSARLDDLEKLAGELAQMVRQVEGQEKSKETTADLEQLLAVLRGAKNRQQSIDNQPWRKFTGT